MVCARILSNDENGLSQLEIAQRDSALPNPYGLRQRRAARLVAHVRAVRQVVCPKLPHEQLIKKRRFVARAARSIKERFIRRGERVQLIRHQRKSFIPVERLVMRRASAKNQRVCEATPCVERSHTEFCEN